MAEQATQGSVGTKHFLDFAATRARADRREFTRRILAMLSPEEEAFKTLGGRSRLNRDGNPLRLMLVGHRESAAQLTFDPHWYIGCARERTQRVSESLEALARDMDCVHLLKAHQQLVSRVMLTPGGAYEALGQGTLLLHCSPRGEQLGFTFDLTRLDAISGWSLLQGWLSDTTEHDWKLSEVLTELRAAGFTITRVGHQAREGEAFAMVSAERDGHHNAPWPHIEGTRAETRERLDIALGAIKSEQTHTEHICVEFSPESGHITRVRTEFEPTRAEARWLSALEDAFITPGEDTHEGLLHYHEHEITEIARLGIEEDMRGAQVRPVLDLKPRSAPSIEGRHRDCWSEILEERILMAIDALYARQHADGAWRDYALPFGSADCFTTAFVGLTLTRALSYSASAGRRAKRAASWLADARTQKEGWGLGSYAGAETRSTALVLRLFGEVEREIRPEDQAWLEGMWDRSGGFIGCNGPRHWSDVHPCVTALAWPALDKDSQEEREEGLHEYLARFARADGRWRAYWWRTHHFSTYHHLYMLEELGWSEEFSIEREVTHLSAEATPFETAWALGIAAMDEQGDGRVEELLTSLLASQQVDGSWPASQDLRMTDPGCEAPWEQPRGELFADTFGVMTTASALWVLLDLASQL